MSRKRKGKIFDDFEMERKTWSKNGQEQKLLEQYIKDGIISEFDGPDALPNLDEIFEGFSKNVLQTRLRETRKKFKSGK
jgi:hypothetical protein